VQLLCAWDLGDFEDLGNNRSKNFLVVIFRTRRTLIVQILQIPRIPNTLVVESRQSARDDEEWDGA